MNRIIVEEVIAESLPAVVSLGGSGNKALAASAINSSADDDDARPAADNLTKAARGASGGGAVTATSVDVAAVDLTELD